MNELLNEWIKEQSDLMTEDLSKDKKLPGDNIDRSNLENWVSDLNKIKVENV